MSLTIQKGLCPSSIRPHGQSPEPCKLAADPSPLRSPIRAPATSLTTRSSSPRSSPNSTRISFDPNFDGNGEGRNLGKQGVVHAFPAGNANPPITKITLKPLADSGFTANRISPNNFCNTTGTEQSLIFCPRPDLPADDPANTMNPQGVYPNQLLSALIRGNRLYLPNIGPQPEPPVIPTLNVQALVYNVDVNPLSEVPAEHVNLNNQIKVETAQPPPRLDRTFGNDLVASDGDGAGDRFVIVSRGGNQVFRATLD